LGRGGNAEEAEARRLSPFSCCDDDDDPTTATSAWVLVVTEESSRVATAITSCMVLGDLIVDYVIGAAAQFSCGAMCMIFARGERIIQERER